jgi:hypothetical protein
MGLGCYEYDLFINLEITVDLYEQDRQEHWESRESETLGNVAARFDQAESFAKAVLKNYETLIPVKERNEEVSLFRNEFQRIIEIEEELNKNWVAIAESNLTPDEKKAAILKILKKYPEEPDSETSPLRLIWERFVIDMSWEAIEKIREGALRIFKLYKLVLDSVPSEATQKFLSRLTRCYVWGFDPECLIICRAVLDTAFRDRVTDTICEKHINRNNRYEFTISNRIEAAYKAEIIDKETKKKAFNVKTRGDKAVHYQPDIAEDAWETVCQTLDVLKKIT